MNNNVPVGKVFYVKLEINGNLMCDNGVHEKRNYLTT
jgi:hypothetical protein